MGSPGRNRNNPSFAICITLFPAILFLLALASFFPLSNIADDVGRSLGPFVSPRSWS